MFTKKENINQEFVISPTNNEPATLTEPTPTPPQPRTGKKKMWIVSAIIALLILAAISYLLVFKDSKTTTTAQKVVGLSELRVGSLDGPIGTDYVYPKPIGAGLSLSIDLQIFEGLVGYSNQKISPLLAKSWKNPDDQTWVFTLKPGVTFQNGKPMTADDVKKSLDSIIANEDWNYFFTTIDTVAATDKQTITITTKSPDPLLLNRLVYGFVFSENDDQTLSGTGPYSFDTPATPTETEASLTAYSNYHQGTPLAKKLRFTVFEDTEALNTALKQNKIDIGKDLQDQKLASALAAKNFKTQNSEDAGTYGLTLNLTKSNSPLAKKQVREALAYAIDRQAFLQEDQSSRVPSNYILPKSVVGFDESAKLPSKDIAKVKKLLAEAGYTKDQKLSYIYIEGIQTAAPFIIKQLNDAGFGVDAVAFESPDEFVAAANDGRYDILGLSFASDIGDGIDFFSSQLSSSSGQFPSVDDAVFENMITQAEEAFQANDHISKVQEINRYAAENYLWIPLSQGVSSYYYQKDLNLTLDSKVGASALNYWKIGKLQNYSVTK